MVFVFQGQMPSPKKSSSPKKKKPCGSRDAHLASRDSEKPEYKPGLCPKGYMKVGRKKSGSKSPAKTYVVDVQTRHYWREATKNEEAKYRKSPSKKSPTKATNRTPAKKKKTASKKSPSKKKAASKAKKTSATTKSGKSFIDQLSDLIQREKTRKEK